MTLSVFAGDSGRAHSLLDALPNPVHVWRRGADGSIRLAAVNAAASALASAPVESLLGRALDVLHAENPEIIRLVSATLADGEWRRAEHLQHTAATGERHWVCSTAARTETGDVVLHTEDVSTRHGADARLAESESRFRGVFEQGSVAMSLTAFDGYFLKVNAAFCAMLGYPEETLLASTYMALTHPDDVASDVERKDLLVAGTIAGYRMEKRFIHADGRTVWADLSAQMIRGADDAPLYLLAQMQDITARKLAETQHARDHSRVADLLQRAPALICTMRGPSHVFELANETFMRFVGGRDIMGKPVADAMPELVEQGFVALLDRVLATGEPLSGTAMPVVLRRTPESPPTQHYVNLVYQAIEDADGTRSGVFVHGVDVTALIDASRERELLLAELDQERALLAASQERHELVLKATSDLMYDWNIEDDSCFFSDALFSAFAHPRDAVQMNLRWWEAQIHPDDHDRVKASLELAIAEGAELWAGEYRFRRGDDSYASVFDRGHIVRAADGAPIRMIGSMADVTERRQLEAQLRESQKMEAVGRLAGGVAHDFNNLLCAILGYADLALMDARESSTVRDEIEEIRKAAQRAAQLTKQLLAFGRRQIRRPAHVDVNAVVRDTDRLLTQLLGEHIQLLTQPMAAQAMVHMDPSELDQILVNLAVNARDAMPQGGTVSIETSRAWLPRALADGGHADCVLLSVTDSGCGIDPDTLGHIFEPFFTTKGDAGTGLGLSTVYGIVKQNGGQIEVESVVGKGTRFQVYLPASSGADAADATVSPRRPAVSHESATVLLAEDENGVRALARRILERAGYRVLEARHGADALLLWHQHACEIDVVVTDLVMPEMGGRTLADRLHESRADLPVLFMSGYSDDEVTRRGFTDSRIAFLAKPFTADSLVGAVREALRQRSTAHPHATA